MTAVVAATVTKIINIVAPLLASGGGINIFVKEYPKLSRLVRVT